MQENISNAKQFLNKFIDKLDKDVREALEISECLIASQKLQIDALKLELENERKDNLNLRSELEGLKKINNDLKLNESVKLKRKLSEHREKVNITTSPQKSDSSTSLSQDKDSLKSLDLDVETDIDSPVKRLRLNNDKEQQDNIKKKKYVLRNQSPKVESKKETSYEKTSNQSFISLVPKKSNTSINEIEFDDTFARRPTSDKVKESFPAFLYSEEALNTQNSEGDNNQACSTNNESFNDESRDSNSIDKAPSPDHQIIIKKERCSDDFKKLVTANVSHEIFTDSVMYVEPVSPEAVPIITIDSSVTSDQDSTNDSWSKTTDLENCFKSDRERYDGECEDCTRYYDKQMQTVPLEEVNMEVAECKIICKGYRSRVDAIRKKPSYKPKVHYLQANNRARRAAIENIDKNTPDGFWDLRLSPVKATCLRNKKY